MGVLDLAEELSEDEMEELVDGIFRGQVGEEREERLIDMLEDADPTLREDAVESNPAFADLEQVLGLEPSTPPAGPLPGEPVPEEPAIRERTQAEREARQRLIDLIEAQANTDDVEALLDIARALEQREAAISGLFTRERLEALTDPDLEALAERARSAARQAEPPELEDFPALERALTRRGGRDVGYFENVIAELQGDREASTLANQGLDAADLEELREMHPNVIDAAVDRAREAIRGLEGRERARGGGAAVDLPDVDVGDDLDAEEVEERIEASISASARSIVPPRDRTDWLADETWRASERQVRLEQAFMTWVLRELGHPQRWDPADFQLQPENRARDAITMRDWARLQASAGNVSPERAVDLGLPAEWFEDLGLE